MASRDRSQIMPLGRLVAVVGVFGSGKSSWMANGDDAEKYGILRSASRTETPYLDTDAFAEYLAVGCRGKADPRKEGRIIVTGRGGERPL